MRSQPQSLVFAAERAAVSQFSQAGPAAGMRSAPASGAAVADYVETLKPRVMSLVVFTGIVGMALAPGHLNPVQALIAVLCIAVLGGLCRPGGWRRARRSAWASCSGSAPCSS